MTTCIYAFTEVRQDNEWIAVERNTYNEESPNRFGWTYATMSRLPVPEKYPYYGLLVDGARTSYPWSFQAKGMPEDCSVEVRNICDSFGFEAYGHSHLTLKELVEKYLELMVSGEQAREQMVYLRDTIDQLIRYAKDTDSHNQVRMVFWFNN